jgi:CRISPR system Cascade subunit CasD
MRFAAPLQAWGADSKFKRRATEREPTKSGVIGLIAAALGRVRTDCIDDLSKLRFGVRVDQNGSMLNDFHMARTIEAQDKNKSEATRNKGIFVSHRYYLSDAVFIVGLEGEDAFMRTLDAAICAPVFPLYLGRRSCPPAGRLSLGIRSKPLPDALREEPWQASPWFKEKADPKVKLSLFFDTEKPTPFYRRDMPVSFAQTHRKYDNRFIEEDAVVLENLFSRYQTALPEHDPMAELGGDADVPV